MTPPWLGAVADDVTGACDLAGELSATGLSTEVVLGVPPRDLPSDAESVVVALKSRTAPVSQAVAETTGAAEWLVEQGASRLYQKYCSTFDSTAEGNIGPAGDALCAVLSPAAITVGTPATPSAGRTQYQGHLFVHGGLLSESSLATHPLTPMTDSNLQRVLARQTPRTVGLIAHNTVQRGQSAVTAAIRELRTTGVGHVLVDAASDGDLDVLAAALGTLDSPDVVAAGGAGLAAAMARARAVAPRRKPSPLPPVGPGRRLILSGSGSERTREQVAAFGGATIAIDPLVLARHGVAEVDRLARDIERTLNEEEEPLLVTATAEPGVVRQVQEQLGVAQAAHLVESTLAQLAVTAVRELGVRRMIVAGGETSGAVAAALGVRRLHIGTRAAPGVPWAVCRPHGAPSTALLLKSGNFGGRDLFTTAWETAP